MGKYEWDPESVFRQIIPRFKKGGKLPEKKMGMAFMDAWRRKYLEARYYIYLFFFPERHQTYSRMKNVGTLSLSHNLFLTK